MQKGTGGEGSCATRLWAIRGEWQRALSLREETPRRRSGHQQPKHTNPAHAAARSRHTQRPERARDLLVLRSASVTGSACPARRPASPLASLSFFYHREPLSRPLLLPSISPTPHALLLHPHPSNPPTLLPLLLFILRPPSALLRLFSTREPPSFRTSLEQRRHPYQLLIRSARPPRRPSRQSVRERAPSLPPVVL